jgi:uncharacterized membrane protein
VTERDERRRPPGDVDQIVQRAVNGITRLAGKASAFSVLLLLATSVVCVGGFLLGVSALSGGIETVWIVLGIVFGALAIGAAGTAWWRVTQVRRHVTELTQEVRTVLLDGRDSSRTVIETFAVDDTDTERGSAIVVSRQMSGFRGQIGSGLEGTVRLSAAVRALTTFPLLVLTAIVISSVFAFLGFIFLIALAL